MGPKPVLRSKGPLQGIKVFQSAFRDQTLFSVDSRLKPRVEKWSKMLIENRLVWKMMSVGLGIRILLLFQMC